jgi:membrane-bound serine protease (ClpP class)
LKLNNFTRRILVCVVALMAIAHIAVAQQKQVYVLELRDEVHFAAARYFSRGFAAAKAADADLVIIHLDTYGGRVDFADSIRAHILNSKIPTAVFIDRNAGSAGALISIACDSIYMAPGASIGAATVVDECGEVAIDKYQSYWRGVMRATAEVNGRDPLIAEKMVDQNLEIPGLSPAGKVITFTNADAIANGYCEGTKNNVTEVAAACGLADAQIVYYQGSTIDKIIDLLNHPTASAILLILMFGGIFLELKTAGMGKGAVVALIAAFLFFVPHYVNGLAETWEVAVFLLGVVLIALELFVIPGFGVAGISGIAFTVVGVTAALLENNGTDFDSVTTGDLLRAIAMVLVLMCSSIILVIWAAKFLVTSKAAHPFVDQTTQDKAEGYTALRTEFTELVGLEGEAITDMRPVGHVHINGKQYDAEADEGYITKGQKIVVERLKGVHLVVKKLVVT